MGLLQALSLPPLPMAADGSSSKAASTGPAASRRALLTSAATAWRNTHEEVDARVAALIAAIRSHYADAHPKLLDEIEAGAKRLDAVLDNVDHRLAEAMANAGSLQDQDEYAAEIKRAKTLLTEYVAYVAGDPRIAHMEINPFGVTMDLRGLLRSGLTMAAKALG